MRLGTTANRLVRGFNRGMVLLTRAPGIGPVIRRRLTTITYVGRRSSRRFTTLVEYRRAGEFVTIGVQLPDAKNWWRNFLEGGGPITLHLDGGDRTGHATARRDGPRKVTVTVQLDPTGED